MLPTSAPSTTFPLLPTALNGVQTVHHHGHPAYLEPLPMDVQGLSAWTPFVERWRDPDEPPAMPGTLAAWQGPARLHDLLQRVQGQDVSTEGLAQMLESALRPVSDGRNPERYSTVALMRQEIAAALLLDQGARPDVTSLIAAVRSGNPRLVQRLLRHGPDVLLGMTGAQDVGVFNESPLLVACTHSGLSGSATIVELLLDAGMSPNQKDQTQGRSAVHWAVADRNVAVLNVLLERGADPTVRNRRGHTPLHYAAARNHPGMVQLLVRYGADPQADTPSCLKSRPPLLGFETPHLGDAVLRTETDQQRRNIAPVAPYRDTPLLQAAFHGSSDALGALLDLGVPAFPPVDSTNPHGPHDDRILRLVEDAHQRARVEQDNAAVQAAQACWAICRSMLEQQQLRRAFADDPAVSVVPDTGRARPRL